MADIERIGTGVGNVPIGNNQNSNGLPPGPPLPANDPWVKNLSMLFPNVPLGIIQSYAASFQSNMYQALNNQIAHDLKKARERAKKFKDSIDDNG